MMNFRLTAAAVLATSMIAGVADAATYLRSNVGTPWGQTTNEEAMDDVFGVGMWTNETYETVDVGNLLMDDFLFLEGGDSNADELEAFLTANIAAIENYVFNGGRVLINSAPNEGDGMSFGFGVDLVNSDFCNVDCEAVDPAHPIFNGPYGATGSVFSGSAFSHATVTGTDTALIIQGGGDDGGVILGEKAWGTGLALFGGMTTDNFQDPDPEAQILRRNILAYASEGGQPAPVPLPAALPMLLAAVGGLGFMRRRAKA